MQHLVTTVNRAEPSLYRVGWLALPDLVKSVSYKRFKRRLSANRRDGRVDEGAPLLREYRVYSLIEGSNPSLSARKVGYLETVFLRARSSVG